jgi:small redox-active disulfide protein 2
MKIQVLGSGCANCKRLYEMTKEVVQDKELKMEVEYITDISKIIEMGVMQTPVVAVDGTPVIVGVPTKEDLIDAIVSLKSDKKCTCGKGCCQ